MILSKLMPYLVDASDPDPVVAHSPHHARHKGAVPVLVLHSPICGPIHKVGPVDVIDDACTQRPQSAATHHQLPGMQLNCARERR